MNRFFPLLVLLLAVNVYGSEKVRTSCGTSKTKVSFFYCMTETEGSSNADIIYYLHGGLYEPPSESAWANSDKFSLVREQWTRDGKEAPRVVEVSFGAVWLLTPPNSSPQSGLLEVFTSDVLPYTDRLLSNANVGSRIILGHSMGGLNASLLAMFKPEVFAKAAMLAPAFFGVSPYASDIEIQAYADQQGFSVESMTGLISIARAFVPDEATWATLAPPTVAKRLADLQIPLYVSSGSEDRLFYEPNRLFVESVKAYGGVIIWRPLLGGDHSDLDVQSLANFLVP